MSRINFKKIKKVHFIGIGGIAVSADAKFMLEIGKIVTGSDAHNSEIVQEVRKKGAVVSVGHKASNLTKDVDLVIYSPAVPEDNVERARAHELGITQMSHTEFIGFLSRQMWTVAVSGTNGKSTTTAMLGLILEKAGLEPTVILGSKVKSFEDGNLRVSQNLMNENFNLGRVKGPDLPLGRAVSLDPAKFKHPNLFIVEGCEYKAAMLNLQPKMIVLTNIEADHLDFYKNLAHIKKTFGKYIKKVGKDGLLIYNMDDVATADVVKNYKGRKVGYGKSKVKSQKSKVKSNVLFKNIVVKNQRQIFSVCQGEKNLGEIRLRVPGIFNVYNAMAAVSASLTLGVDFKIIKKSLEEFTGIWRRFEIVGEYNGATIISDYAHHPIAIQGTIKAAREFYSKRRIIAVFQPHSHNRTRKLFTEFAKSFNDADLVILSEVYDVEGRENPADKVSSRELAEAVKQCRKKSGKYYVQKGSIASALVPRAKDNGAAVGCSCDKAEDVFYAKDLKECEKILHRNIKKDDIVLIMGAGDIYKLKI